VRIPPAPVSGFSGSASGTVAHFSWSAGSEPDLAGYDITDVSNGTSRDVTPGGVDPSVCSGSNCSVDIDFGSAAQGSSHQFVIRSLRYTSPSHSGTLSSDASPATTVNFPAPPTPTPSTGGSGGGGGSTPGSTPSSGSTGGGSHSGGGAGGGTTTGGTVTGGTAGGKSGGKNQGISSSHPNAALKAFLPATSAGAAPDLPSVVTEVKPLPQGTYQPTLAYPDQVLGQTLHKAGTTPLAHVSSEIVRVLNVAAVWKTLAGAVLVLLVAAHLRAFVAGDAQD
jgi:hypothetical protein